MISCPRCPGAELIDNYETGDVVCPECGLVVLDRVIDVQWPVLDTNVQQCRVTKIKTVNEMGQKLHLPETVLEKACLLFKPVSGRSNEAVYAACLYMACRQERVPRTFKEICAVSTVSKKEIGRAYKQISRVVVERVTPDDLVNRFCSKLGLTRQVRREVAELTVKNAETGRPPSSVVAAAIYLTSGKSQREIKEVTGVSEVTIRHAVKLLCNRKGV